MEPDRPTRPPDATGPPEAVWEILARWRAERRRFVLATVIDTRGFTPRKPGARMLIGADGATAGTIGGGAIEQLVLEQASRLIASGGSTLLKRHLTQELGMCCGGEMAVFLEAIEPRPRLHVYGAGYIGRALAQLARTCDFEVTIVDPRPEWATNDDGVTFVCRDPVAHARALADTGEDFAVVVTHDHAVDQEVVQELLRHPFRFLGMIGSVPKARKFALRLRARGFSATDIARLHCPLGVAIGAQTPEEIAVSVMGELVLIRRGGRADDAGAGDPMGDPMRHARSATGASSSATGAGLEPAPEPARTDEDAR
jgi:xanthine dehydrogenase accessory factor